jgi:hypothetical protein
LKSNLPNEVDWAFNKLVKLSYQHQFYVAVIPTLPETLIDHTLPFFDQLVLNTSPQNFETSLIPGTYLKLLTIGGLVGLTKGAKNAPQISEMAVFNILENSIMIERFLNKS